MHFFVYGTLMAPEVVETLILRMPRHKPARVTGYSRHRIKGFVFPAMVPAEDAAEVQGLVLYDLTEGEAEVFNEFEGDEYYTRTVRPTLEDGSTVETTVYLWQDSARHLLYGEWDYQEWRREHLREYVHMCSGFKSSLESDSEPVEPVEGIHTAPDTA